MTKRTYTDESGASLMLVILFVTIFGVIIATILDFSSTGFKTTQTIAEVRTQQHAFDGAMDGAINAIRGSSKGLLNNDCTSPDDDFVYDDPDLGTITVTCDGVGASSGSSTDNVPEFAVLTTGTDPSEGFIKTGNNELTIDGGIWSNSKIDVQQNRIAVFGDAYAVNGCPPESGGVPTAIFATGEVSCHEPAPKLPAEYDYDPAVSSVAGMTVDPPATCASSNSVVKFVPGLYTRPPINHVPSGCNGDVWWLSPGSGNLGVYYFNFDDAESHWDLHADDKSVVGGTPNGWTESSNANAVTFPGSCAPGTEAAPNPGVQVIFGGQTRWSQQTHDEAIEVCTWGGPTGQRIAFYGLRPEDGSRTQVDDELKEAVTAAGTGFAPNPPNTARSKDNAVALASLAGNGTKSASLTLSDYADIPAGSRVVAASLEITHSEAGTHPDKADLTWTWRPQTGSPIDCSSSLTAGTTLHTDTCDILPGLQAQKFPHAELNQIQSTLDVNGSGLTTVPGDDCLKPNGDPKNNCTPTPASVETAFVSVDAIVLKVTYVPPGFEAHRCATVATPPSCAILEAKTNPTIYFQGTFYAPTARVVLDKIHNTGDTVFRRGIIARTIEGNLSASSKQTDSPFQLPGLSSTRAVIFEAHEGGPTGTVRLRAKVEFVDVNPAGLPLFGYQVKVLSWVVVR